MGLPLPEDPYAALGVAKDASAATIKTQYRKLVLKCHPDKVQDEARKALAVDHFHKIQTAYEIIGDEDRRSRYDAQVRLAQLREDVMKRQSAAGARTAEVRTTTTNKAPPTQHSRGSAYFPRDPDRTAKVSPQYEERKPAYAAQYSPPDYFDSAPRPTPPRKESEFERSSQRPAAPRRESERVKPSPKDVKENERARHKERSRTEREVKRSRDRRQSYAGVAEESDSDEQEIWRRRKMREEDLRRAYHQEAQAQAQTQTQKQDARRSYYDSDERQRKVASQADAAREHIDSRKRRAEPERRPSPVRMGSSKEKMAPKRSEKEKPGLFFRWGAGKPKPATRDSSDRTAERRAEREAAREEQRRSSADEVEGSRRGTTADELRRPPNLQHSKSSPAGMHTPEEPKLRAPSAQVEPPEAAATTTTTTTTPPRVRRAETMPNVPGREREARWRETLPRQASGLRQTEVVDGLATPATTPEYPEVKPAKYQYRREYADDTEFATPDGYRTEERMPDRAPQAAPTKAKRHTRSPSAPHPG
ncbi:DnaJ domain, partial [Teratosphaeria destructans]